MSRNTHRTHSDHTEFKSSVGDTVLVQLLIRSAGEDNPHRNASTESHGPQEASLEPLAGATSTAVKTEIPMEDTIVLRMAESLREPEQQPATTEATGPRRSRRIAERAPGTSTDGPGRRGFADVVKNVHRAPYGI